MASMNNFDGGEAIAPGLQPLTAALLDCVTVADVVEVVVERGIALLGARAGLVALLSNDGQMLHVVRTSGYSDETMKGWEQFPLATSVPVSDALRTNAPVLLEGKAQWAAQYPKLAGQVKEQGRVLFAAAALPLSARGRVFGGLHFSFAQERVFSQTTQEFLSDLARQCALALDRALLLEREEKMRVQAEKARDAIQAANQRLEFLTRATALLGESLDYQTRLDALVHLCVPEIADWSGVDMLGEDGSLERLAVAHWRPEHESVMRELQERYPPELEEGNGILEVIQTGKRLFYPNIPDELIGQGAKDAEHARLLRLMGTSAALVVPITARGRTLGALTLGMGPKPAGSGRTFDEAAIALAEELADRAGVAVDNSRLYHQAQRDASARREAENRFAFMADSAPVLMWTSGDDGKCNWFNEPRLAFTGRTMAQEIGYGWAEVIHPDDVERCRKTYLDAFAARQPFTMEYRMRRWDGEFRWLLDSGVPVFSDDTTFKGFIGSCVDVTEQRGVVERQRRFVREMLASVTEGRLCLCDAAADLSAPLTPASEVVELSAETLRLLRKRVTQAAGDLHLSRERTNDLLTAVSEASMNAVKHGVGGTARVHSDAETGVIQVWIKDNGKGIRDEDLHRATLEKGWSGAGSFGHGFFLMLRTADRTYLLTNGNGTTVVLEQAATTPEPSWLTPETVL